jgi:hypothetical protein
MSIIKNQAYKNKAHKQAGNANARAASAASIKHDLEVK